MQFSKNRNKVTLNCNIYFKCYMAKLPLRSTNITETRELFCSCLYKATTTYSKEKFVKLMKTVARGTGERTKRIPKRIIVVTVLCTTA